LLTFQDPKEQEAKDAANKVNDVYSDEAKVTEKY